MAEKLIRLHVNHPKTYEFLNALVDIAVKGIPFFILILLNSDSSAWVHGENAAQRVIAAGINVILFFLSYIMGMAAYLLMQVIVQVIKLFVCSYKKLVIHIRVFDLIIKSQAKKIKQGTNDELCYLYYRHVDMLWERDARISVGIEKANRRQQEKDVRNLEYAKKQYERHQSDAEYYRNRADGKFESARRGDGLFTTAEEKRKQAGRDLDSANFHSQTAEEERRQIENLERKLGKR